jgi:hypothetical protein
MRRKRVQESRVHEVRENIPSEWRRKEDLEQEEASSGKRRSIPRDQGAIGQYPSPPDDSLRGAGRRRMKRLALQIVNARIDQMMKHLKHSKASKEDGR